jgi:hypothetical protein
MTCSLYQPSTRIDVPHWTECTTAADCNTCGRDIWVGERCVISGPTIHCWRCGRSVSNHEDTGEVTP